MITKEQREEIRRQAIRYEAPSVMVTHALLDALDEMERQRDAARENEDRAIDVARKATARAEAAERQRDEAQIAALDEAIDVAEQVRGDGDDRIDAIRSLRDRLALDGTAGA